MDSTNHATHPAEDAGSPEMRLALVVDELKSSLSPEDCNLLRGQAESPEGRVILFLWEQKKRDFALSSARAAVAQLRSTRDNRDRTDNCERLALLLGCSVQLASVAASLDTLGSVAVGVILLVNIHAFRDTLRSAVHPVLEQGIASGVSDNIQLMLSGLAFIILLASLWNARGRVSL